MISETLTCSKTHQSTEIPVILGGGAARAGYLVGFLDFLESRKILAGYFLGVSVGSVVGALKSNGLSNDAIADSIRRDLFGEKGLSLALQTIAMPINSLRWYGLIDIVPAMKSLVETHSLKPNDKLKIVAYDLLSRSPVVFQGDDYDIALALAASCAVPGLIRPVPYSYKGRLMFLVDGGVFHPQPGTFSSGPAIVGKLIDYPFQELLFKDRSCDFVVSLSDVDTPFFTQLSVEEMQRQRKLGWERTAAQLAFPLKHGLIPAG